MQRPAEDERERDHADAGHVGAMIEARQAGARRHRDAELLPQPIAAELQLLDGGRHDVLDDHQARMRGDDHALGRDQSVRDFARVLVQQRHGGNELADQAQRGVDVELQVALVRDTQDVGEARAFDVVRDDGQSRSGYLHAIDAPNPRVVGVAEVRQPRRPFAQRELERRHRRQRRPDAKNLQQLACGAIGCDDALAEAIAEQGCFGPFVGQRYGCHWSFPPPLCNRRTSAHAKTRIGRKSLMPRPSQGVCVCMWGYTRLRPCRVTLGFVTGTPRQTRLCWPRQFF